MVFFKDRILKEHHLELKQGCYFLSSYPDKSSLPQRTNTELIHCHVIKIH